MTDTPTVVTLALSIAELRSIRGLARARAALAAEDEERMRRAVHYDAKHRERLAAEHAETRKRYEGIVARCAEVDPEELLARTDVPVIDTPLPEDAA